MVAASRHRASVYAQLFALTFVGFPFVGALGSALGIYSQSMSIAMRGAVVALGVLTVFLATPREREAIWRVPATWVFIALWVALLLRFVWDATFVPIPLPLPWFQQFLIAFGVAFFPAIALLHAPRESAFDDARRWIMLLGALSGVLVAITFARARTAGEAIFALTRLSTDSLNPITTGHMGVGVVIAAWHAEREAGEGLVRRIVDSWQIRALCSTIGVLLVVASVSKGPVVALLAAIFTALLSRWVRERTARSFAMIPLVMFGIFGMLGLLAWVADAYIGLSMFERIANFAVDTSTTDRFGMFERALQQFEHAPLTGSAIVELETRIYPHNLLVDTLMVVGAGGFLLLLAVLFFTARAFLRILDSRHSWIAMVYAQYFVGAMFSGSVYLDPQFWCVTTALIGLERLLNTGGESELFPNKQLAST